VCFDLFDTKKQDYLSADDLDEIMRAMGFRPSKEELQVTYSMSSNLSSLFLVLLLKGKWSLDSFYEVFT